MTPLRKRMFDELQFRNYADFTIERYLDAVQKFAEYFGKSPQRLGAEQVRKFLLHLVQERKVAPSTPVLFMTGVRSRGSNVQNIGEETNSDRRVRCGSILLFIGAA